MAKYDEPKEGEWVRPIRKGYKLACCDCGLTHRYDFRIRRTKMGKRVIEFRVFAAPRSTAMIRRHNRITVRH